jgi:hypothetical protein
MPHEDVLTEIGSQFSSALEIFLGINSDTESYGTPESRARGLLAKFRQAQGMPEMLSSLGSLAMPRSECSGPFQFTQDTGTTGGLA